MPKSGRSTRRRGLRRVAAILLWSVVATALGSIALVALLRWVDPPTSAFMLRHRLLSQWQGQAAPHLYHEWVPLADLPAVVPLAVIAAEDQRFPNHRGFDLIEMRQALASHRAGGRLRGASTISQQTAKNLFLWPGRDWLRKGLEAWFTQWMEWLWPKRRILEVYLNIAQFSPDTFGVGAASWRYFNRPAVALERRQAALLAAVLPNPNIYRLEAPSARVQRRVAWIETQMRQLGGAAYLQRL